MALMARLYFNAVFGALGGLLGWMLFGIFGDKNASGDVQQKMQMALGGGCIGGCIGYLVVSVDALRDGALIRVARLATYGVVLGSLGGAIGMVVGDEVNYFLVNIVGSGSSEALVMLITIVARGLGWMVLGIAIGASEGIAAKSLGKLSYGIMGGAVGGFFGGCLFGLIYYTTVRSQLGSSYWANAFGLVILGACIGSLSALVQAVFQPASVKVLRGWQEGREYALDKASSLLGRDEHADIALFRDMKVEKKHAFIRREDQRFLLINQGAPPQFTLVNDVAVRQSQELHDGDRIQLGNVVLRFQTRAATNRAKTPRSLPVAVSLPPQHR